MPFICARMCASKSGAIASISAVISAFSLTLLLSGAGDAVDFTVGSAVGDAVAVASGEGVGVSATCSEAAALLTLCVFSAVPQATQRAQAPQKARKLKSFF